MVKSLFACTVLLASLATTFAATKNPDIAIWIPYWRKEEGASTTIENIKIVTQISPFAYEVNTDGTLKDMMKIDEEPWTTLAKVARANKKPLYPSILWGNRSQMETILNDKAKRAAHIKAIVAEVKRKKWDGIDIDYEGKSAGTREGFSLFLTELGKALKKEKKKLICTIEARTPLDSRYLVLTPELVKEIEYANDFKVIGRVCDQVRIMAYDQSEADVRLKTSYRQEIYRPVADIEWVKKVLTLALEDIPARKLVLGVPTYGYMYEVLENNGYYTYKKIGSINFNYAEPLAQSVGVIPTRNRAGERSFVYSSTTEAGNTTGERKTYVVWYSDAQAIADKLRIAKLYGLAGIAIFKIDGGFDPTLWSTLKAIR